MQIASNALFAQQVGLQVVANNIANANTEGYIRQRTVFTPGPTQKIGKLPLGLGVKVDAIIQNIDRFVQSRLRAANSDLANSQTQKRAHLELEVVVGELSDTDLSTSLNNFFGSINNVVNQPGDISLRRLAVLDGVTLSDDIRRLDNRVRDLRVNINREVIATADDINRLTSEIAQLNVKIVVVEEGGANASDAVGLRDQRGVALAELANIVGIEAVEQDTGSVYVSVGGEFLISDGTHREVVVSSTIIDGTNIATVNILSTDAALRTSTGKLAGLYNARDEIYGGFLTDL
jgi:flagellar hook-associated protein 1 FlgK